MLMCQQGPSHLKWSSSVCRPCELCTYDVHACTCTHKHSHAFCRYPWHVMFTGLRSLVEARGILDGNYFANDDDGQYIGYQ